MTMPKNLSRAEIATRRKEIAAEDKFLLGLLEKMDELEAEWAEYYQARVVGNFEHPGDVKPSLVGGASGQSVTVPTVSVTVPATSVQTGTTRVRSKNDLIIEALSKPRQLWQTANKIRDFMEAETGHKIKMTSVSPALSALKKSGTIVRNELSVALALRVETEEPGFLKGIEPPEGTPSSSSFGGVAVQH